MQTARDSVAQMMSTDWNETNRTILSELISIILQVRRSLEAIESEIAREAESADDSGSDIIVLDDVTPTYAQSCAILRECDAGLSTAVRLLLESMTPGERKCDFVTAGSAQPACISF